MKIATWNVNSLRARIERVAGWIESESPDVLLMQETKCKDEAFPAERFSDLGYASAHHGSSQWNGVAICSRIGLEDVRAGFFDEDPSSPNECRLLSATCADVRVYSVYVPNGRVVGSEHYEAKLEWLHHLRTDVAASCSPSDRIGIFGDFNVAPEDRDVWDIEQLAGATHVTPPEREALGDLLDWGFEDGMRVLHPDDDQLFTWWDYRAGAFHRGWGMRIDLGLFTKPLAASLRRAWVDRDARKGPQPSDHAPVVFELDS